MQSGREGLLRASDIKAKVAVIYEDRGKGI